MRYSNEQYIRDTGNMSMACSTGSNEYASYSGTRSNNASRKDSMAASMPGNNPSTMKNAILHKSAGRYI